MRHGRIAMLGLMLSWGAGGAAWAVSCAGSQLAYAETGNTTMNFPLCSFRSCQLPTSDIPVYTFDNPGCDPTLGVCAMKATVAVELPGNHQNDPAASGGLYSFAQVTLRSLPRRPPGLLPPGRPVGEDRLDPEPGPPHRGGL